MNIFRSKQARGKLRAAPGKQLRYRRLSTEALEERALLAGDLAVYQNQLMHGDVNADGSVNVNDVTAVISQLRSAGPHSLVSSGGAQGEGGSSTGSNSGMFVDVNGDNFLSVQDATSIISQMRAQAAAGDVSIRLETTVGGVVSNTVGTNQTFTLNVYIQDNRTDPGLQPADLGVLSAELDVQFNAALASAVATGITPGPSYDATLNSPNAAQEALGLVDNSLLFQFFSPVSEQQSLKITGGAATDTFTLTINLNGGGSATTGAIAYNADATAVQTAVDTALSGVVSGYTAGDLAVTGTVESGLTFDFSGSSLSGVNHPPLTVDTSGYVTGTPNVTITTLQDGSSSITPLGGNEFLLFSKTFLAGGSTGTEDFQSGVNLGTGASTGPGLWTYATATPGQSNGGDIPFSDISFGSASIDIVPFSANAPVGVADSYSTNEDTPLVVSTAGNRSGDGTTSPPVVGVLDNDTDADQPGTTLSALLATPGGNTAHGHVVLNSDGTFTYTPNANYNGTDSFQYITSDGGRQAASPTTVTITVSSVPDNPVANDDPYATPANTPLNISLAADGVLGNDSDADSGDAVPQFLQVTKVNGAAVSNPITLPHGQLTMNADGTFIYTPNTNFIGVETFTYTADSFTAGPTPTGEPGATATVSIEVGIVPRNVSGFVYNDANNNGNRDAGEAGIGGVQIQLSGLDFHGAPVSATTTTNVDGSYTFSGIFPGTYTISESQPSILQDGQDTPGNLSLIGPVLNDQFTFQMLGDVDAVDFNFGELGRKPEFFSLSEYLASSSTATGALVGFGPGGVFQFVQLDPASWPGILSLTVTLNGNGTATLTAVDTGLNTLQTTIATAGDPRFQVLVQTTDGLVVRLNGNRYAFFP